MTARRLLSRILSRPRILRRGDAAHRPGARHFNLQHLEDRVTPVTNTWTGSVSDLWNVAGNWSAGIPVAGQDVVIASSTNTPVVLSGTAANIDSLTSSQAVQLQATTLTLTAGGAPATGGLTFTNGAALTITGNGFLNVTTNSQTFGGDGIRVGADNARGFIRREWRDAPKGPSNLAFPFLPFRNTRQAWTSSAPNRPGRLPTLLCANMPGKDVAVFGIYPKTGRLKPAVDRINRPSPSGVMLLP